MLLFIYTVLFSKRLYTATCTCTFCFVIKFIAMCRISPNMQINSLPSNNLTYNNVPASVQVDQPWYRVRVLFHNLIPRLSIYTRRTFWARMSMLHVIEFNLCPKSSASQSIGK